MRLHHSALAIALSSFALSAQAFADGTVRLDFDSNSSDSVFQLRLGSDGRIYAMVDGCRLLALDANGTLISTFGANGRVGACHTSRWKDDRGR
jgi:hypothetical protein